MPLPITPCTVCSHKQVAAIDAALISGRTSFRALAWTYGLNTSSLHRHWKHHVKPRIPAPKQESEKSTARVPAQAPSAPPQDETQEHRVEERRKAWARFVLVDLRQSEERDGDRSYLYVPESLAPPAPRDATTWDERKGVWRRKHRPGVFGRDWM